MLLKMSAKWRLFRLGLDELMNFSGNDLTYRQGTMEMMFNDSFWVDTTTLKQHCISANYCAFWPHVMSLHIKNVLLRCQCKVSQTMTERPHWLGDTHKHDLSLLTTAKTTLKFIVTIYIYAYIYVCVCVCVCVKKIQSYPPFYQTYLPAIVKDVVSERWSNFQNFSALKLSSGE